MCIQSEAVGFFLEPFYPLFPSCWYILLAELPPCITIFSDLSDFCKLGTFSAILTGSALLLYKINIIKYYYNYKITTYNYNICLFTFSLDEQLPSAAASLLNLNYQLLYVDFMYCETPSKPSTLIQIVWSHLHFHRFTIVKIFILNWKYQYIYIMYNKSMIKNTHVKNI